MSLYEPITSWRVPRQTLPISLKEMAPDGKKGCEGIVLWLGRVERGVATVERLVGLRGPLVKKLPLQIHINALLFNKLCDVTFELDLTLVGQIHSHPGTYTDLSIPDKRYGVTAPHYLSVVAPHYAQKPHTSFSDCGVHVYEPKIGFRRLAPKDAAYLIQVTANELPPILLIGESP